MHSFSWSITKNKQNPHPTFFSFTVWDKPIITKFHLTKAEKLSQQHYFFFYDMHEYQITGGKKKKNSNPIVNSFINKRKKWKHPLNRR